MIHDISRTLRSGHPTWPGDPPFSLEQTAFMARGDSVNVSRLASSVHVGTHVDAPYHYAQTGATLEDVPLEVYLGPARVIHAVGMASVPASVLEPYPELPERVLIHTGQPAHWDSFPEDFCALEPELIHALAARGVRLIGTDSPSVDPLSSKTLEAHHACLETGLYILEGLNLHGVQEGEYGLICLPLPLGGVDGAPARAVLVPLDFRL